MVDNLDPLKDINQVPWCRLVHFYGRAADIPQAIRDLATDDHVAAEKHLLHCLEHQDSLSQATPFAVFFIVGLLDSGRVRDPEQVHRLLSRIGAAARFQIECHGKPVTTLDWNSLLAEERLWPEFKSKYDDEVRWEEWDPTQEEWMGWAALTN